MFTPGVVVLPLAVALRAGEMNGVRDVDASGEREGDGEGEGEGERATAADRPAAGEADGVRGMLVLVR